jgi:hypothetical protein
VLAFPLLATILLAGTEGCAVVIPTLPQIIPGYGCEYHVVSKNGDESLSGLLLLRSDYVCAERMIAVFKITEGRAVVPAKIATRFSYSTLMDIPVYFGLFENPKSTYVFPLVPGYVAEEPYYYANHGRLSAPGWKEDSDHTHIVVLRASPDEETELLRAVSAEMAEVPELVSDLAVRQQVLEYARRRISELRTQHDSGAASPSANPAAVAEP